MAAFKDSDERFYAMFNELSNGKSASADQLFKVANRKVADIAEVNHEDLIEFCINNILFSFPQLVDSIIPYGAKDVSDDPDLILQIKNRAKGIYHWLGGMDIPIKIIGKNENVEKYRGKEIMIILAMDKHTAPNSFKTTFGDELDRIQNIVNANDI